MKPTIEDLLQSLHALAGIGIVVLLVLILISAQLHKLYHIHQARNRYSPRPLIDNTRIHRRPALHAQPHIEPFPHRGVGEK